jgi:hypothetical protein
MRGFSAWKAILLIPTFALFTHAQNTPPKIHESQGMPPRATPGDYPSQAHVGSITIAAEFMGHAVPRPDDPLSTEDYVVVEVGLFGPKGAHVNLSGQDFSLRINGKKKPFPSEPYELVDSSLKDPAWAPPTPPDSKSKSSFSSGGQSDSNTPPPVVHMPFKMQRAMAQYVEDAALPEGDRPLPKAGLIFFRYHGLDNKIHSLQLIYSGALGKATVELQP